MALVSYDYGSGSENEEEESSTNTNFNSETPQNGTVSKISDLNEEIDDKLPEILTHLPKTKTESSTNILDDKLEDFIPKAQPQVEKKPQKVKITIPSLSEFEEEEEPQPKVRKISSKGSGLLAMLPPVKGTILTAKSFVPNVIKNKPQSDKKPSNLVPEAVRKKAEEAKKAAIEKITKRADQSDNESDDDIELPETFDDEMWQKVCGPKSKPKKVKEVEETPPVTQEINIAPEPVKPYEGLDNAAFKELVGKAKRPVNIKLVDINEEEVLADKDVWLAKSLTDPDLAPKKVVEEPVDPTRKKKHHITYLAEQAKANEQELAGQWSANKFARNQTRAKYGF